MRSVEFNVGSAYAGGDGIAKEFLLKLRAGIAVALAAVQGTR